MRKTQEGKLEYDELKTAVNNPRDLFNDILHSFSLTPEQLIEKNKASMKELKRVKGL